MANVKFYLDKGNILLSYYISTGDVVRFSIKEKIDLKHWDKKKCRSKYTYKHANKLNNLMDDLSRFVMDLRIDYKVKGINFNGPVLKQALKDRIFGNRSKLFYDYATNIFLPDKVGKVKDETIITYNISIGLIEKYLPSVAFDEVNRVTTLKLEKAMQADGYSKNYINRVFKLFHQVMKVAYVDEIHDNKYFMSDNFVPSAEEVENDYLTIDELDKIYYNLHTLSERNKNAAIIFLRGCYTGQRYQSYRDLTQVMIYEIQNVSMINLKQGKTQHTVSIPLSDKMKAVMLLDVHPISRQKLSDYIKEVIKSLKINKKISTHTARRTFATNMVLAGVDISKIMKITGHKTEKEFRKYVKIDGVQSAISVIDEVNKVFGAL